MLSFQFVGPFGSAVQPAADQRNQAGCEQPEDPDWNGPTLRSFDCRNFCLGCLAKFGGQRLQPLLGSLRCYRRAKWRALRESAMDLLDGLPDVE